MRRRSGAPTKRSGSRKSRGSKAAQVDELAGSTLRRASRSPTPLLLLHLTLNLLPCALHQPRMGFLNGRRPTPTTYKFEKLDIRSSRPYISRREWFVAVHSPSLLPPLLTRLLSQHALARRYCCRPSSRSPHKEGREDWEHGDLLGTSAAVAAGARSRFLMQTILTTSSMAPDERCGGS